MRRGGERLAGLQDYRLGRVLGRGSTGVVVEAVHETLGFVAAVKHLRGRDATREARTIARIDHPNVLAVFDAGEVDGGSWFAMQRAKGPLLSVSDHAHWHAVITGILRGLSAAHAADVLHLDVKPGNVLVLDDGEVALADFGIAVLGDRAVPTLGTPGFMAPEVREGRADARSDLYAAGAVAYALLAGHPPGASGLLDPLPAHLNLVAGTFDWLQRCLAPRAEERFQHVADALAALPDPRSLAVVASELHTGPTVPLPERGSCAQPALGLAPPPAALPPRAPLRGLRSDQTVAGAGLLGFRRLPLTGRDALLNTVWGHLLEVERTGRFVHVAVRGARGAGLSRFVEAFRRTAWAAGAGRVAGPRVAVVSEGRAPNTLRLDEDVRDAEVVIDVPTLDLATVRAALVGWTRFDPALVTELADTCGGDLGLCVEVVGRSIEEGTMQWTGGRLVAEGPVVLSRSEVQLWGDRLAALRPGRELALQAAAAMGHEVDARWLEDAVGPNDLIEVLVRQRLASPIPAGVRWASGALRLAAAPRDATVLHERIAAAVRGDDAATRWRRCVHRWRAGDRSDLSSLFALATDRAATGAMVETERVLRDIEQQLLDDPAHHTHWVALYSAFSALGPTHLGYDAAEAFAQRALDRVPAEDGVLRARLLIRLAWLCNMRGLPRRARPFVEEGLRLNPSTVRGAMNLGYVLIGEGRSLAAERAFRSARERAAALGLAYSESSAAGAEAIALRYRGRNTEAIAMFRHHRRLLNDAGFHAADADNTMGIADAQRFSGNLDEALRGYLKAIRLAQTGQSRADLGFEVGLALCWWERHDLDRAEALLAGCLARVVDDGPTWNGLIALYLFAVRAARDDEVHLQDLEHAATLLLGTGYVDPDLPRAMRRLVSRGDRVGQRATELYHHWEAQLAVGLRFDPEDLRLLHGPGQSAG